MPEKTFNVITLFDIQTNQVTIVLSQDQMVLKQQLEWSLLLMNFPSPVEDFWNASYGEISKGLYQDPLFVLVMTKLFITTLRKTGLTSLIRGFNIQFPSLLYPQYTVDLGLSVEHRKQSFVLQLRRDMTGVEQVSHRGSLPESIPMYKKSAVVSSVQVVGLVPLIFLIYGNC